MSTAVTHRALAFLVVFAATLVLTVSAAAQSPYAPVTKYDPKRDASQDITEAAAEAKRTNRRVLLEVGGEWCIWCHRLDEFFEAHQDLTALRDKNFVTVKINFSEENPNKEVLSRYSPIAAYPHLLVLDAEGNELHSQDTGVFEEGKSYVLERLTTFLTNWAPAAN
jgi:thiol:disulfide interchange protein